MGSELVVKRWCDRCEAAEADGFHAEQRITVGDVDRVVDLCSTCADELLGPLIGVLADLGVDAGRVTAAVKTRTTAPAKPTGKGPGKGKRGPASQKSLLQRHPDAPTCPVCLEVFTPGNTDKGESPRKYLASHLRRIHQRSVLDFTDQQLAEAGARARANLGAS